MSDVLRIETGTADPRPSEIRQVRRARGRAERHEGAQVTADSFPTTEAGDSEFFAHLTDGRLLYDHTRRRWFRFGPHHWRVDATEVVIQSAVDAMRRTL